MAQKRKLGNACVYVLCCMDQKLKRKLQSLNQERSVLKISSNDIKMNYWIRKRTGIEDIGRLMVKKKWTQAWPHLADIRWKVNRRSRYFGICESFVWVEAGRLIKNYILPRSPTKKKKCSIHSNIYAYI